MSVCRITIKNSNIYLHIFIYYKNMFFKRNFNSRFCKNRKNHEKSMF